jgi:hypothetical protein
MRQRLTCVWRRVRRPLIGGAVAGHFALGLLCFAQAPSALLEIPGLPQVLERYKRYDFPQTWRMFSPPSQTIDELGYAFEFPTGWTDLLRMNSFLEEQAQGRVFLTRGYIRIADHFRHPVFRRERLVDEPFYFHYFQQLSAFFCFGDGMIPGLKTVRFYSIVKGVPPFFATDSAGHALPKAEDFNKVEALYQRECRDR